MTPQVEIIADQVAERMRQISLFDHKHKVLAEAFRILTELEEKELTTLFLTRSKKIGDKLKSHPKEQYT